MAKAVDHRYFTYPTYGQKSSKTSGTWMDVILGPEAFESINRGSSTNTTSIASFMGPLNDKDYSAKGLWVAGHLLNDNFGGSGTSGENLTPLTQNANHNHSTFENYVKLALICSRQMLDFHKKIPFVVGVHYTVEVSTVLFGDYAPYNKAPSHITVTSRLVKASKSTGDITPLGIDGGWGDIPPGMVPTLQAAAFVVTIDNDDAHLKGCVNKSCAHV